MANHSVSDMDSLPRSDPLTRAARVAIRVESAAAAQPINGPRFHRRTGDWGWISVASMHTVRPVCRLRLSADLSPSLAGVPRCCGARRPSHPRDDRDLARAERRCGSPRRSRLDPVGR
jgi:hypothetical protein